MAWCLVLGPELKTMHLIFGAQRWDTDDDQKKEKAMAYSSTNGTRVQLICPHNSLFSHELHHQLSCTRFSSIYFVMYITQHLLCSSGCIWCYSICLRTLFLWKSSILWIVKNIIHMFLRWIVFMHHMFICLRTLLLYDIK